MNINDWLNDGVNENEFCQGRPCAGMPEQTPRDMELREYALGKIKSTYKKYGFTLIETPAVEHIENLTSKQGGENEQLIFKILKRGEKLQKSKILTICATAD